MNRNSLIEQLSKLAAPAASHNIRLRAMTERVLIDMCKDHSITEEELALSSRLIKAEAILLRGNPNPPREQMTMEQVGPIIWLHWQLRSMTHKGDDRKWIKMNVEAKLCALCLPDFRKAMEEYAAEVKKPDFDYFRFVWAFHNRVNVKLGKPEMPLEVAQELYAKKAEKIALARGTAKS